MTETMGRERGSARLPSKPDTSAKLAVPQPALEAGKTLGNRTVRQSHGRSFALAILHAVQKRDWIGLYACQLLTRRLFASLVVGRPAALERGHIPGKMFKAKANKLHRWLERKV